MMTTKEIAAMRDKLAAEMPQANEYRFPTLNDLFAFVGMEPSASFTEQVAASVKAEAKIRYMYADAMMEARKSSKDVTEEPVAGDEIDRLYRLEALAKKYKDALEWQDGGDAEWQDRLTAAQEALFKEL